MMLVAESIGWALPGAELYSATTPLPKRLSLCCHEAAALWRPNQGCRRVRSSSVPSVARNDSLRWSNSCYTAWLWT